VQGLTEETTGVIEGEEEAEELLAELYGQRQM
jgi:hypothetical protein